MWLSSTKNDHCLFHVLSAEFKQSSLQPALCSSAQCTLNRHLHGMPCVKLNLSPVKNVETLSPDDTLLTSLCLGDGSKVFCRCTLMSGKDTSPSTRGGKCRFQREIQSWTLWYEAPQTGFRQLPLATHRAASVNFARLSLRHLTCFFEMLKAIFSGRHLGEKRQ